MSYVGLINKIPVYSTIEEAVLWAKQYNLTGYHQHTLKGVICYMGGATHKQINEAIKDGVQTLLTSAELRLGQFVVTSRERQAYIEQPVVLASPVSSITVEIDDEPQDSTSESTPVALPTPVIVGGSTPSGGSGGSGGSGSGGGGGY